MPLNNDQIPFYLRIVPVPTTQVSSAQNGAASYDSQYFYVYSKGWKRIALTIFVTDCRDTIPVTGTNGNISFNDEYFYIYISGQWSKTAIVESNLTDPGKEGDMMVNNNNFYIYTHDSWKYMTLSQF